MIALFLAQAELERHWDPRLKRMTSRNNPLGTEYILGQFVIFYIPNSLALVHHVYSWFVWLEIECRAHKLV